MKRVGTLELDQDLEFQKKEWLFERCGWVALLLFIVAALAGLFGSGPVSRGRGETADGIVTASYPRFLRWQTPHFLEIQFAPNAEVQEVGISRELMDSWNIQAITPEPAVSLAEGGQTTYRFEGRGEGRIRIEFQSKKIGGTEGVLNVAGGRTIRIRQMAFP